MQLAHTFAVPLPPDQAWATLLDLELVASCFPGAQLEQIEGDVFEGRVRVKLGPVSLTYRGQGRFVERDEANRRLVLDTRGRDSRGSSTAAAVVTAVVTGDGDGSRVDVTTDLDVTGAPAQLGGGALEEVSNRLLDQFVERLRARLEGPEEAEPAPSAVAEPAGAAPSATGEPGALAPRRRSMRAEEDESQLDLIGMVLGPDASRLLTVGGVALLVGLVLGRLLHRRRPIQVVLPAEIFRNH